MNAETYQATHGSQLAILAMLGISNNLRGQRRSGLFIGSLFSILCVTGLSPAVAQALNGPSGDREANPLIDPAPTLSSIITNGKYESEAEANHAPPAPESKVRVLPSEIKWSYIFPEQAVTAPAETPPRNFSNPQPTRQQNQPESNLSPPPSIHFPLQPIEARPVFPEEVIASDLAADVSAEGEAFIETSSPRNWRMGLLHRLRFRSPYPTYRDIDPHALWSCPTACGSQPCGNVYSDEQPFLVEPAQPDPSFTDAYIDTYSEQRIYPPDFESLSLKQPPRPLSGEEAQQRQEWDRSLESIDDDLSRVLPVTEALPASTRLTPTQIRTRANPAASTPGFTARDLPIIVHPPLVQPYRKNQYTFVIENQNDQAASNVTVQLSVPKTTTIFGVLPSGNSIVADHVALFRIESIPPRGHVEIHIGAIATDNEPIKFESSVSVATKTEFSVADSSAVTFRQVGSQTGRSAWQKPAGENESRQPLTSETAAPNFSLPGGSRFIRNPFTREGATETVSPGDQTAELSFGKQAFAGQDATEELPSSRGSAPGVLVSFGD
jgi:hypothetical protein